ncbi:MAG: sugar phosphate isomerase/epimerase [Sulfolobaceae archaeon]|nr:sugar phosphate isomerase/epimerase [Sulfolobaceae archaeon]
MKLGIISDEISQDFEHSLKVMKELGATHVEVRDLWGKNVTRLSDSELAEMRRLIEKYGLTLSNLDSPAFKIYFNDAKAYEEHLNILRKVIELTKRFDLKYTRIFTFWWQGELDKYLDKLIEGFQPAIEMAEDEGVYLVVENEYSCTVGNGKETKKFLQSLNSKWIKALWDPGNAFFTRETPYPDGFNYVKEYIMHVHVKDAVVDNGAFKWRPVGKGAIDYRGQFKELIKMDVVVSLETHYIPQNGGKEEGTRESFKGILKILEELNK